MGKHKEQALDTLASVLWLSAIIIIIIVNGLSRFYWMDYVPHLKK